jgi:hypothetical protein
MPWEQVDLNRIPQPAQVTVRGRLTLGLINYIILELEISTMNIFNKMKNKIYNTIRTKYTTQSEQNIQHSQNSTKIYNTVRTVLKYTTQSERF